MTSATKMMPSIVDASETPRRRKLWVGAVLYAAVGGTAAEVLGGVGSAAGVPMRAAGMGAQHAESIATGMFAMGTAICTFWGFVIAVAVRRFSRRPARMFAALAVVLTGASLLAPLAAAQTAGSTKVLLLGAHVLVAAIVIPGLVR
jgi:hypothetical protein